MLLLAGCRWLEKGELELSQGVPGLLSLRRERRNSSVRRIDDEGGPPPDGQVHCEGGLDEFAVDVSLRAACPAAFSAVSPENVRNLSIELRPFRIRKKLSAAVLLRPLQGYVDIPG